jgi:hypothetical protein
VLECEWRPVVGSKWLQDRAEQLFRREELQRDRIVCLVIPRLGGGCRRQ